MAIFIDTHDEIRVPVDPDRQSTVIVHRSQLRKGEAWQPVDPELFVEVLAARPPLEGI